MVCSVQYDRILDEALRNDPPIGSYTALQLTNGPVAETAFISCCLATWYSHLLPFFAVAAVAADVATSALRDDRSMRATSNIEDSKEIVVRFFFSTSEL